MKDDHKITIVRKIGKNKKELPPNFVYAKERGTLSPVILLSSMYRGNNIDVETGDKKKNRNYNILQFDQFKAHISRRSLTDHLKEIIAYIYGIFFLFISLKLSVYTYYRILRKIYIFCHFSYILFIQLLSAGNKQKKYM